MTLTSEADCIFRIEIQKSMKGMTRDEEN